MIIILWDDIRHRWEDPIDISVSFLCLSIKTRNRDRSPGTCYRGESNERSAYWGPKAKTAATCRGTPERDPHLCRPRKCRR
ncbi:unnamed protein product, partial [Iphiclides podalirius]